MEKREPSYMSINRWVDKEDMVHIHNAILLSLKKEWNSWFWSNMMDIQIIILNEVSQKEKDI